MLYCRYGVNFFFLGKILSETNSLFRVDMYDRRMLQAEHASQYGERVIEGTSKIHQHTTVHGFAGQGTNSLPRLW